MPVLKREGKKDMLKNFYFSLTPEHQDLIFTALVDLGTITGFFVIVLIFIIIIRLLDDWVF